jgi:hypothetical protein
MSAVKQTPTSSPPLKRGRKPYPKLKGKELRGRNYLSTLKGYLQGLRTLYPHPLRVLFYDDVVMAYLIAFFNPTLRGLRCIEDASEVPGINQYLSVESVCKSTLSDANALFDPEHLQGLIHKLREDLPNLHQQDDRLDRLLEKARAVDGSYFRVAADVQWALHQRKPDQKMMGSVRLNCQFCLKTGCPDGVSVTGDDGISEGAAATALLKPKEDADADLIYLFDSGVVKFSYLRAILDRECHFLCSLSKSVGFDAERELPLDQAARAAGVASDRIGHLTSSHAQRGKDAAPKILMREVLINYIDRHGQAKQMRLLTDLIDLPVHLIAELYKHRWEIELFFRWLKVTANFRHLTSHGKNGVTLGFHIAIIAMLLTCLHTQAPLSIYGYNMMAMVAAGLADLDDILPILAKRERERAMERARQARKRAAKLSK